LWCWTRDGRMLLYWTTEEGLRWSFYWTEERVFSGRKGMGEKRAVLQRA